MNFNKFIKIANLFSLMLAFLVPSAVRAGIIDSAPSISEILMNALNFLLSIAGGLAMLSLIISGVMYMLSEGDEGKMKTAKRAIGYSVVGLIVSLLSLVIVKQLAVIVA